MTTNHISTTRPPAPSARSTETATGTRLAMTTRPFPVLATVAGAGAALGGLLAFAALAVVGWFLADAGAHGDTRDAVRVAADAWLVGHGAHLTLGGVAYGVVPVGLTLLLGVVVWRAARWAVRVSPPQDDREAAYGIGLFAVAYLVVAVVAAVLAGDDAASPSLVRTVVGALVLCTLVGGVSVLRATAGWSLLTDRLPTWLNADDAQRVLGCAARTVLTALGAAVVTVLVSLALHAGSLSAMLTAQDLSGGDLAMLALVSVVAVPNAALLAVGYLAGPGFALGTGTTVSTGSVVLGPVPAFPLLGALPASGTTPWWTDALLAVPPLLALAVVVRRHRRDDALDWRHGLVAGLLAGAVLGLLSGLGGGALGDGRMSEVGTSALLVAVFLALSMGAGGLLGGALAPLLSKVLDAVGLRRPEVEEDTVVLTPQASISPALAARLRAARREEPQTSPSRPPFGAATARGAAEEERTVMLPETPPDTTDSTT